MTIQITGTITSASNTTLISGDGQTKITRYGLEVLTPAALELTLQALISQFATRVTWEYQTQDI